MAFVGFNTIFMFFPTEVGNRKHASVHACRWRAHPLVPYMSTFALASLLDSVFWGDGGLVKGGGDCSRPHIQGKLLKSATFWMTIRHTAERLSVTQLETKQRRHLFTRLGNDVCTGMFFAAGLLPVCAPTSFSSRGCLYATLRLKSLLFSLIFSLL